MQISLLLDPFHPASTNMRKGSEIVEALHEMINSRIQVELATCKLKILQKQEAWKEKEEELKEKEYECKARKHSLTSRKEIR